MKTNFQRYGHSTKRQPHFQAGFSIVELMIAITIGLLLLAALTDLIVQQMTTRDEFDKASRQIENGRYATQVLHDDIEHAGFYGQLFTIAAPGATLPDPCATDLASLGSAISLPVQGYDAQTSGVTSASGVVSPLPSCLAAANYLAGDILVIRRADSSLTTIAAAKAGPSAEVYMQATGGQFVMNTGSNADTTHFNLVYATPTKTGPADLRAYFVHIYFISPCSTMANGSTCKASDDNGNPIPTLKRLELSSGGTFTIVPLVEGIQNMQLDYGIDSDGDGYSDRYSAAPASTTDWSNVVAIRINLLARNNDSSSGYSDAKTYSLGLAGPVGPFNDTYKRHVFSEAVRVVNLTGRRAQQ